MAGRKMYLVRRQEDRCEASITLRDGSGAQCQRYKAVGSYCTQHARLAAPEPEARRSPKEGTVMAARSLEAALAAPVFTPEELAFLRVRIVARVDWARYRCEMVAATPVRSRWGYRTKADKARVAAKFAAHLAFAEALLAKIDQIAEDAR